MNSVIVAENIHHGKFVQQGLKYEGIPVELFSIHDDSTMILEHVALSQCVFILVHHIEVLDELIRILKVKHPSALIIVLTNHYDPLLAEYVAAQKVHHFFVTPFPFQTISLQVRLHLYNQSGKSSSDLLKVRDLELYRYTHEVRCKGQVIHLRNKEFVLLEYLMMNVGKLLTREAILESVWDRNADMFTNTVDVHINKLRKKIDYSIEDKFIHTIHCAGYIFS